MVEEEAYFLSKLLYLYLLERIKMDPQTRGVLIGSIASVITMTAGYFLTQTAGGSKKD
jgi:hypothetical protein